MNRSYNTVIVDDHPLFAEGIKRILSDDGSFNLTHICSSAEEFLHLLNNKIPHLVLMDIQMPGMSGIELCKLVKQQYPAIKVVMISMFESSSVVADAKNSSANGYFSKATDALVLKSGLNTIMKGEDVFLSKQTNIIIEENKPPLVSMLSKRELDIIGFVKQGHTSKSIAEVLSISQFTVDTHRKNILKKLQLPSVKALIAFAHENGI